MALRLIPNTGVQFSDFEFNISAGKSYRFGFSNEDSLELSLLEADPETGDFFSASGDVVPEDLQISGSLARAMETFAGKWLPLPFYRNGTQGPVNWARAYFPKLADTHDAKIVFAFDTTLLEHEYPEIKGDRADAMSSIMPTNRDATTGARLFSVPEDLNLLNQFSEQKWVKSWIKQSTQGDNRQTREQLMRKMRRHCADYLSVLYSFGCQEELRPQACSFVDTVTERKGAEPVDVDLVLDIGNSRTFGLLVEASGDGNFVDLNKSYHLQMRDLSRPDIIHERPFASRVEFCKPELGNSTVSRMTGRPQAFSWPSAVRIGDEAIRLAHENNSVDGTTGMSSPKRYLWSKEPVAQEWRFNRTQSSSSEHSVDVGGYFDNFSESGEFLPELARRGRPALMAMTAKFSRSSLMTFFMMELLLQALREINSPSRLMKQGHPEVPSRLRRIVLTMPTAMTKPEQGILERRIKNAIEEVWLKARLDMTAMPKLEMRWDEASATQAVFVYNEVVGQFFGYSDEFLTASGREVDGKPNIRIVSLDIGGGTSDLIISSYSHEAKSLRPTQEFREGFQCAGDDIVKKVIENHVIPALGKFLADKNIQTVRSHLVSKLGSGKSGDSELNRLRRQQFTQQILIPIAYWILEQHEGAKRYDTSAEFAFEWSKVFYEDTQPTKEALRYFCKIDESQKVDLTDLTFSVSGADLILTVSTVMRPFIESLAEATYYYDCDYMLLSGRPSRFPAVQEMITRLMPVTPDRIIPMHNYEIGKWYPFQTMDGRIGDPKTCAAVGAMICALSEGQLYDFNMKTSEMSMRSTARFIGQIHQMQLRERDVLFSNVDLEDDREKIAPATFRASPPVTLGFRQMAVERWPATMLLTLNQKRSNAERRVDEIDVTLARKPTDEDFDHTMFDIEKQVTTEGDEVSSLDLKLQTMLSTEIHWADAGNFEFEGSH